jgi:hypothetical protein
MLAMSGLPCRPGAISRARDPSPCVRLVPARAPMASATGNPTTARDKLFHRHAMLHESHERTNGRPTA